MNCLKVLLYGVFSARKTACIKNLSEIPLVSTQREGIASQNPEFCPVALDFGRLTFDTQAVLYLFGTPGSRMFDLTWSIVDDFFGVIFVVDSSYPYGIQEARYKVRNWIFQDIPLVVVANKQDKLNAWHPDMIRVALSVPPDMPVLPCVATTGEGVAEAMINLCEEYLKHHFPTEKTRHSV